MDFTVPKVPCLLKKNNSIQKVYDELPVTLSNDVKILKSVGSGSFGNVILCLKKDGKQCILKIMKDCTDHQAKLFVKEAKIIHKFKHSNIIQFDSLYQSDGPDTLAFLMEYVYFDFIHFKQKLKVSSLKELLLHLDRFYCKDFEHFQMVIAKDITRGLSFLHENKVVHRDLKPDNVLISNQHYSNPEEMAKEWKMKPVVAKITDFGESRTPIIQTMTLVDTKTNHILRGTAPFVAPEAFVDHDVAFGLTELKNMDVWALLMIFYILINPDKKFPFEDEINKMLNAGWIDSIKIMKQIFKTFSAPKHSDKYQELRLAQWITISNIFENGTSTRRPSSEEILLILEKEPNTDRCKKITEIRSVRFTRSGTGERDSLKDNWPVKKIGLFGAVTYNNPPSWIEWCGTGSLPFLKMQLLEKSEAGIPDKEELDRCLPVHRIDRDGKEKLNNPTDPIQFMWIGHATFLVQFDGLTVLTDPVFLHRCSPVQLVGPYRYRPVPCEIDDLPKIDAVVISHNHYDHLEQNAVVKLNKRFKHIKWYVPEGTVEWFRGNNSQDVKEMTWWDENVVTIGGKEMIFCCVPAQHCSQRTPTDAMKSLWCGWVIKSKHTFYFSGDTGYCPVFKIIGQRYGPMDLSAIPIGGYAPRYIMKPRYIAPKEAVMVHTDVTSKCSIGIHWGTFDGLGSHEFYLEPKYLLEEEVSKAKRENVNFGEFFTVDHGQIIAIKSKNDTTKYCEDEDGAKM